MSLGTRAVITLGIFSFLLLAGGRSFASALSLRIPREFFESPFRVEIQFGDSRYANEGRWVELPTTLPPPDPALGPVLGDFRDFQGCVISEERAGNGSRSGQPAIRLCFNVMPDVTSVGVNDREMTVQGLEGLVSSRCEAGFARPTLLRAEQTEKGFNLVFGPSPANSCKQEVQLLLAKGRAPSLDEGRN